MAMSFSPNSGAESPGGHFEVGNNASDDSEPPGKGSFPGRCGFAPFNLGCVNASRPNIAAGATNASEGPKTQPVFPALACDRRIRLMLIEDNPGDVFLTRDIIEQMHIDCDLTVVEDGEKAVELLRHAQHDAARQIPLPDLVLLDLNLPRKTGREVLADIRDDPELAHLPVVVLTSSDHTDDMAAMLGQGASSYMLKPMGRADMMHALDLIVPRRHDPV